jgi:hypothetical protein
MKMNKPATFEKTAIRGIVVATFATLLSFITSSGLADERETFFENNIRPILVEQCYACHSANAKTLQANLLVDSPAALRRGGDSGPAVVPHQPDESTLLQALKYEHWQMPPTGKLPDPIIANFRKWIADGAIDPRPELANAFPTINSDRKELSKTHWAYKPIQRPEVPIDSSDWPTTVVDSFIQTQATTHQRSPGPDADKATLLRRLYLNLIGLPPTAAEVLDFVSDDNPDAVERVVDRLLASPHYGERWGRYWLDLARYADSNGADENHSYPVAWRYRDYVVRQLNADLPYDEFVTQQLAGDLLEADSMDERRDQLTATGFLVLGPKMLAEQDKPKMIADLVDEQLDTLGQSLLAMTIGCARCHDHKFDPVSTEDYYALAGILHSTKSMANLDFVSQWNTRELPDPVIEAQVRAHQEVIAKAEAELTQLSMKAEKERTEEEKQAIEKAKQNVEALKKNAPSLPQVMAVDEAAVKLVPIHVRGNHLQLKGDPVARRLPSLFENSMPQPNMPEQRSGRLELAHSLFHSQNPLTSRVIVNRLWAWLYGQGIVRSVSNFGIKGDTPSHPELLDWLAAEMLHQDWSLKAMQRKLVLSRTFRLSSIAASDAAIADPDNRYWTHYPMRRLEIEPLRDSLLSIGGNLDRQMGGQAASIYGGNYSEDGRGKNEFDALRRTIYLPVNRAALHELLATFDYVESGVTVGKRNSTVVPHQMLFLMNHPLARQQASELVRRVATHPLHGDLRFASNATIARIQIMYLELFGRLPDDVEVKFGQEFLQHVVSEESPDTSLENATAAAQTQAWTEYGHALITTNEFMYIP